MSVPNGEPGQGVPGPMDHLLIGAVSVPEGSPEAEMFAADGEAARSEGPVGDEPTPDSDGESGAGLSGDDQADPGAGELVEAGDEGDRGEADTADLEQYPENVRELLKGLPRGARTAIFDHVKGIVKSEVQVEIDTERTAAEELRAKAAEAEAERKRVRERFGRYVGEEDIEVKDSDGNVVGVRPSYAETERLLGSRRGEDILEDKYGMSRSEAYDWKDELTERRAFAAEMSGDFDDRAWARLGHFLRQGLQSIEGIDPDAMVTGAEGPQEVIQRLHGALEVRYAAKEARLKKGYEDRIAALTANGEALNARAAGATARRLETGGMTTGGGSRRMTLDEYARLSPEQAAKLPSRVIDEMTALAGAGRR